MTSVRPTPDESGAQRMVRMQAAYAQKVNSLVDAGRDDLVPELSDAFAAETATIRRDAGRRTPTRNPRGRGPGGGRLRRSLRRFDRYTLDVFNAGSPYRSDRSA